MSDRVKELERQLASYQACRVRDVDEKAWLSKRMTALTEALRDIHILASDGHGRPQACLSDIVVKVSEALKEMSDEDVKR